MKNLEPYRYEGNPTNSGVSNGTDLLARVLLVIGIILVIAIISDALTPKCIASGCDNDRREGSSYCYLHDD